MLSALRAVRLRRAVRVISIWRTVLTLLAFLWWDARVGAIGVAPPLNNVSNGKPCGRAGSRASCSTPAQRSSSLVAVVCSSGCASGGMGRGIGIAAGQRSSLRLRTGSSDVGGGTRPTLCGGGGSGS